MKTEVREASGELSTAGRDPAKKLEEISDRIAT
jgi:hypothetical protein